MRKSNIILLVLLGIIAAWSCTPRNPFGGPVYDFAGNLKRDSLLIADFLKTAPIDSLYRIHDASGVVIIVQEEGNGIKPSVGNLIYCNYTGRLLDGIVFDTNSESVARENDIYDENRQYRIFQFSLGGSEAIRGFDVGFRNLKSGSKGVLIIPSPWAYQDRTTVERVPANSVLVFDVEFLGLD
ncbi:FKBP-type peptidyl-prolyl cis-trans isomerase [Mariniradius saccharolyticus]|uniref:FKBP-type peptidyl-prolyl cis-trans isomerase n=1 Tax=Mariniradius saccharolyticus TaxID=1245591 RepID=UPI0005916E91|nr:FKBP-type peptidyl-prolyl cis-trans isomerase [Mariniradius saccharolyticus]